MTIKTFVTGGTAQTAAVFTVADNNAMVYGGTLGNETVRIQSGITGVSLDANIERLELSGALAAYKFVVVEGTGLQIQNTDSTIVATIPNINQNVKIAFSDGSATLVQSGATIFTLGDATAFTVGATSAAAAATLTLASGDLSTIGTIGTGGADTTPPAAAPTLAQANAMAGVFEVTIGADATTAKLYDGDTDITDKFTHVTNGTIVTFTPIANTVEYSAQSVTAKAADAAGNLSIVSTSGLSYTFDNKAPTSFTVTGTPDVENVLTFVFSENVDQTATALLFTDDAAYGASGTAATVSWVNETTAYVTLGTDETISMGSIGLTGITDLAGNVASVLTATLADITPPIATLLGVASATTLTATSSEVGTVGLYHLQGSGSLIGSTAATTANGAGVVTVFPQSSPTLARLKVLDAAGNYASQTQLVNLGTDGADSLDIFNDNAVFGFGDGDNFRLINNVNGWDPSDTSFSKIADFGNADIILFVNNNSTVGVTDLTRVAHTTTASSNTAAISSTTSIATFDSGTVPTLAAHIAAVELGLMASTSSMAPTLGNFAVWQEGLNAYLFITDGQSGVGAGDVLVQLTGISLGTDGATLGIGTDGISTITSLINLPG